MKWWTDCLNISSKLLCVYKDVWAPTVEEFYLEQEHTKPVYTTGTMSEE